MQAKWGGDNNQQQPNTALEEWKAKNNFNNINNQVGILGIFIEEQDESSIGAVNLCHIISNIEEDWEGEEKGMGERRRRKGRRMKGA